MLGCLLERYSLRLEKLIAALPGRESAAIREAVMSLAQRSLVFLFPPGADDAEARLPAS